MEAVKLILENEDKLNLSWHHGCHYDGVGYRMGMMGRCGALGLGISEPKKIPRTGFPDALCFEIKFNEIDNVLYEKLSLLMVEGMAVTKSGSEYITIEKRIKDEFQERVKLMQEEHNKKYEHIDLLMKEIEKLRNAIEELGGRFYDNDCEYSPPKLDLSQYYEDIMKILKL